MIHIDVENIHKSFGGQSVLNGLSFQVQAGEHIGLVGPNGAGKTTLLKILTGELLPDKIQFDYHVSLPKNLRVGLVSQLPEYERGTLVIDVLRRAYDAFAGADAYLDSLEVDIRRMAGGLMLTQLLNSDMNTLSGGEKTRVNLARLLLEQPDLLLLDEPTNHLDLRACEWLEEHLSGFRGTVLAVSHDRWFLDRFARRTIEIDGGVAESYPGNYSFYSQERENRRLEKQRIYEKERDAYAKLSAAALQMREWAGKNAKLHRRAENMEKRAARILTTQRPKTKRIMRSEFSALDFRADDIFRIQKLTKLYGERKILDGVSLNMRNGERVALLGDNGAGKSTLIKIVAGELIADGGTVWQGPAVKWGYLPQEVIFDHPERGLVDTLLYEIKGITPASARDRLAAFQFTGEKVFDPVSALSGGERSRLRLCILMSRGVNLLMLDEPTNHLDIDARAWVENALGDFDQAILFVSHDRYFIEQFATRIWWLENGEIWDYEGNYPNFREALRARERGANPEKSEKIDKPKPKSSASPLSLQRKREQAAARLERDIEKVETELQALEPKIAENPSDFAALCELLTAQEKLQIERDELYAEYERLEAEEAYDE
ncbi:putative ABC transporter ATP-binding protein YdiF [Clostridia bacterium]|nr:putative ABC transporter ATP-binding protein YdiF [Clostridia bacterium]